MIRDRDIATCKSLLARRNLHFSDDPDTVLSQCLLNAERGDPEAQYIMAVLLSTGVLGTRDEGSAVKWCVSAAKARYMPAVTMLANFHVTGAPGIAKDSCRAVELLKEACDADFAAAAVYLASAYLQGFLVPQDRSQALSLLRKAANLGDLMGQFCLGDELVESEDSSAYAEGVACLQAAADRGLPSAHYSLSMLYRAGRGGLSQNLELAERHVALGQTLENEWHRELGLL